MAATLVPTAPVARTAREEAHPPRPSGWWGMTLVVATEAMFFVYLLFSYFYLSSMSGAWPPGRVPELRIAGPNTVILLVSSLTMWWGERGIARGSQTQLRIGLLVTLLLGVAFLALQGVEYHGLEFTPQSNAYGSLFFTITGFHGAHVAVGLLMNLVIQLRAWLGHFDARRHSAVSNVGLYWHFVDAVWLVVFTSLYLSPRFL